MLHFEAVEKMEKIFEIRDLTHPYKSGL